MERSARDSHLGWLTLPVLLMALLPLQQAPRFADLGARVSLDGHVLEVTPDGPAAHAGLEVGDRLQASPPTRPAFEAARPGEPLVLERRRGDRSEALWLLPLALDPAARRSLDLDVALAVAIALLGAVVWTRRGDALTRTFLLLTLATAVALAPAPRPGSGLLVDGLRLLRLFAQMFCGPLLLHVLARFPSSGALRGRSLLLPLHACATLASTAALSVVLESEHGAGHWVTAWPWLRALPLDLVAFAAVSGLVVSATRPRPFPREGARRVVTLVALALCGLGALVQEGVFALPLPLPLADLPAGTPALAAALVLALALLVPPRGGDASRRLERAAERIGGADAFARTVTLVTESLGLEGCTACLDLRPVAHAGRPGPVSPPSALTRALQGYDGLCEPSSLALRPEERDELVRAGVRWLLPVDERTVLLLQGRLAGDAVSRGEVRALRRVARALAGEIEGWADLAPSLFEAPASEPARRTVHPLPAPPSCDSAAITLVRSGGDSFEPLGDDGGRFAFALGDATGHDLPAALLVAASATRRRDEGATDTSPGAAVNALHGELRMHPGSLPPVRVLAAQVDANSGTVTITGGGMPAALLRRADGGRERIPCGGAALGASDEAPHAPTRTTLEPGDVIVLHTDGLGDAALEPRLWDALDRHARDRAAELALALLESASTKDDTSVVVVKRIGRVRD